MHSLLKLKQTLPGHVNMAELGPATWKEIHGLADKFAARVGDSCECGKMLQGAMRGLHDAVNVKLGKPVQHFTDLKRLAAFTAQAQVQAVERDRAKWAAKLGQSVEYLPVCQDIHYDYNVVDMAPTEEDKRREAKLRELFQEALEEALSQP